MGIRHVRRIPHPSRGGARTRRSNMAFHTSSGASTANNATTGQSANSLASLTPANRDSMDPIAGEFMRLR